MFKHELSIPSRNLCQVVLDVFVLNDTFETFCHVIFYQLKSYDKKKYKFPQKTVGRI